MSVEVGSEAPDFTLRDENGEEFTLSSLRGRNVVLVFYPLAFSSHLHQGAARHQRRAADRYDAAGAEVLGISVDSPYRAQGVQARRGHQGASCCPTSIPKGEVATQYGAYIEEAGIATRATFVIDKDGKVAYKVVNHPGEARDQEEYIEALAACPV